MRALAITLALGISAPAVAQYKNSSFGLDVSGWMITKPSIVDPQDVILPLDQRPLRLANGLRLGGESNFKMEEDHWWLVGRLNIALLQYAASESGPALELAFDQAAEDSLGTLLGVQGQIGIRYVILTDRFRPYLQASVSFLRLLSFSTQAGNNCGIAGLCGDGQSTFDANFLSHPNVGAAHLQPGAEIILARDVALHLFVDLQHWLIWNAVDNQAVVLGIGIMFFG